MAVDWSRVPEKISSYTESILREMPDEFTCDGGIEGLTSSKIEGKIGRWAITILYKFNEDLDHVILKAISTDSMIKEGLADIIDLKDTMIKEFLD